MKDKDTSLNLREAMLEADERIAELTRRAADGDEEALRKLVCLALGGDCCDS